MSFGSRQARSDSDTVTTTQRKPENHGPIPDRAKEWTDAMTPLLVMKVPKIERQKAMRTRTMFQTFNIPFFSWIITEWMKADMASHGMRLAFSTGSQAQ